MLTESEAILRFADEHVAAGTPAVPGRTPTSGARSRRSAASSTRGSGPTRAGSIYVLMFDAKDHDAAASTTRACRAGRPCALRALWPLATRYVARHLGITATTRVDDERRVRATFDAIADRLADGRRHLCGDRFTAADLTFACLSSAVIAPPQYGVRLPQPEELPDDIGDVIRSFREHPAGAYALELFRSERPARANASSA